MSSSAMKILVLATSFLPTIGGAEFVIHHVARHLVYSGHRVLVLAPRPLRRSYKREIVHNYHLIRYPCPPKSMFLETWLQLCLAWVKLRWDFDILHAHVAYPAGYVATKFAERVRVPVVITCHGADVQTDPNMGYGIRLNPSIDRKVRLALQRAPAVTTISRTMMEEVALAGTPHECLWLIPNGVDLHEFESVQADSHSGYVLGMGRLVHKKGFDLLLRAFSMVASQRRDVDLMIVGEGPEEANLRQLATGLGLSHRVQFVGFRHGAEKIALLKGCELFAACSRREPMGIVILEALAAGRAVVATQVDGIPDMITHGFNGLLVEPEDAHAAASAMLRLLKDDGQRRQLERRAMSSVARYDWPVITDRYAQIYSSLLKSSRSA